MENARTLKEIQRDIIAARDSIIVINEEIFNLDNGIQPSLEIRGELDRNVGHLKIIVAMQDVIDSGEDITDLHAAILIGEAKLAEDIWSASTELD